MSLTVVQALPMLEVGGVERGTLEVAEFLVCNGHRSIVISANGRLVPKLIDAGSEHIPWSIGKKSLSTLRYIKRLRSFFTTQKIDIVHARSRLPAWIVQMALQGIKPKDRPAFVTTVHGPYTVNRYSAIMCRGQRVIAVSKFIRDYILNNYPDTEEKAIRVIHRGVDSDEFPYQYRPPQRWQQQWDATLPRLKNKFILTIPARITRWKGQEDFIHIIHGLKQFGIPVHGLIAGAPYPHRQNFLQTLKKRVSQLGLEEEISFLGHRDDLKNIMSVSNLVFSLARNPEAFGRTALEALCLGIPVIAYDHGGASEVLGRMFPIGKIPPMDIQQALARSANFYQSKPVVANENPFPRRQMLEKTLQTYQEVVKR